MQKDLRFLLDYLEQNNISSNGHYVFFTLVQWDMLTKA